MAELAVVGKSLLRIDAKEKVTGKALFARDLKLPRMLYGKILRSSYPHARIIKVDTSKAERLRGVHAVVTGRDAPPGRYGTIIFDQHLPAREVVRFIGEPVAAVAAETPEIAEEAIDLIEVEYEELPAVFDAEEAMKPNPPAIVHPDLFNYGSDILRGNSGTRLDRNLPNVFHHYQIRHGDAAKGFREADLVMESRFSKGRVQHCQMEPHTAIARVDPDGGLTIWSGRQGIFRAKFHLAGWLGITPSKIRVLSPYVGGGFGGKLAIRPEAFAALLAIKSGRPVKVAFTREEVFIGATTDISTTVYIKDGVKRDGTIVAREMKIILNGGAYADSVPLVTRNCSFGAVAAYRIPNFKLDSYGVYTNQPIAGPLRGLGCQHPIWAVESHMDMLAEKLGIDAVELRRRNLLKEGEANVTGEITHSIGALECLEKAAEFIEWGKPPKAEEGPWKRGKGIALGNKYGGAPVACAAAVRYNEDGIIEVRHGADELGQGCNTVLGQLAAEEFGVGLDRIKVVYGDTDFTAYDLGSTGSKTTYNTGNAVRLACQDAKRQIFELASSRLEVPPEELETKGGRVYLKGRPETGIAITDLFSKDRAKGKYVAKGGEILGKATWLQPYAPEDPETGQIDAVLAAQGRRLNAFYIHGCQAAEVAVNVETGEVKVLRMASAFDMGQPINPIMCEAQMEGGAGMGIGGAIYEEMVIDNGAVVNPSFMDYKMPTVAELPLGENVKSIMAPAPHKDGPFGAKGLGEGALTPTAPAIGNAIYNAVGIRIKDLPITREKILKALKEKKT